MRTMRNEINQVYLLKTLVRIETGYGLKFIIVNLCEIRLRKRQFTLLLRKDTGTMRGFAHIDNSLACIYDPP